MDLSVCCTIHSYEEDKKGLETVFCIQRTIYELEIQYGHKENLKSTEMFDLSNWVSDQDISDLSSSIW